MAKRKPEPFAKRPRIDGVGKLSPVEKAERDARTQHGMKLMAMSTVYEAAQRSGWHTITLESLLDMTENELATLDLVNMRLHTADAVFQIHSASAELDVITLRKIKTL